MDEQQYIHLTLGRLEGKLDGIISTQNIHSDALNVLSKRTTCLEKRTTQTEISQAKLWAGVIFVSTVISWLISWYQGGNH